jgi:hypothetical protein
LDTSVKRQRFPFTRPPNTGADTADCRPPQPTFNTGGDNPGTIWRTNEVDQLPEARRVAFDGESLVVAIRATFRRRGTALPDAEIVALSDQFVQDSSAQANWKAFTARNQQSEFESLQQVVSELQRFLREPLTHARSTEPFAAQWSPGGPWV